MTETTSKVEKWSYPLKVGAVEAKDPMQYYAALAKAKDGYYPLGANGLWHGGVHFDEGTGLVKDLTEVRCIADGEVVAYRIDEAYPKSDFGSTHSVFSTGFVLVKHRLEMPGPPAPATVPGSTPAVAPLPGPSLTFFSLYMHLLDWEGYKANPALKRPEFWGKGLYQVKANAPDKSLGLRVRGGGSGQFPVLAVLPRGTTILTKPATAAEKWLEIVSVTPEYVGLAPNTGWVFKGELKHLGGDRYFVGESAKDAPPDQKPGANVRDATSNGLPIAFLPVGTQIKISEEGAHGKYRKLVEIVSGQAIPALTIGTDGKLPGFVWLDSLEAKSEPHSPRGEVVQLTPTFKIKAGDILGHVGKYQNHSDAAAKNLLHMEVFSCEDVKAFKDTCLPKVSGLAPTAKTVVKIPKNSQLITHQQGMNATNPPKVSDSGVKTGFDFFIPVSVLEALPTDKKIKASIVMGATTTTTFWWRLDGVLGDGNGNPVSGWFAEPDISLSRHTPWEWEGFEFIKETVSNADHLAATLHAQEQLTEEERSRFLPQVSESVTGPVNDRLYKIVDTSGDKKLSSDEIVDALKKPWHAQSISQLVTNYENEWYFKPEKWDALDELMGHADSDPNKAWQEEKLRIKSLGWWDKLIGQHGITDDAKVWHISPVALIGNFSGKSERQLITLAMLKKARPSIADDYCDTILPILNKYAKLYSVNTPLRVAHLLSQVGHESGFKVKSEVLDYSAVRMRKVFGCRNNMQGYNDATDECIILPRLRPKLWSEESTYVHNAVNLGSYVYASRNGNGDEASQEGYKYRGRGIIQLTGKNNYREYTRIHNEKDPSDPRDFLADPDLIVNSITYGIESAFVWWDLNNLNSRIAQSLATRTESNINQHVADISIVVNGGTIGLTERVTLFNELRSMIETELN